MRRLVRNLDTLGVANMRTLEMKVADAGPEHLRVDPHVLTKVRRELEEAGRIIRVKQVWFHRETAERARVQARLALLEPLYARMNDHNLKLRLGQTLEIAILRALEDAPFDFVGGFVDLDQHDDSTLYRKEEPPLRFSGRRMPGERRFDFLAFHASGPIGIEAKNIREWMYPDRDEIKDLLLKAVTADTLPVMITRRIPYVTFRLLQPCGVMLFENFNQLYPTADAALAAQVRQKDLIGYHDVRAGNAPNPNLQRFIQSTIPGNAVEYRERFNRYRDLLERFATDDLTYAGFAARVRRREQGVPEDSDEPPEADYDYPDPNEMGEDW